MKEKIRFEDDEDTSNHYVDKQELNAAMIEWKERWNTAPEDDKPPLTDYLAECILKIAKGRLLAAGFRRYSYREEMMLDGIENCIRYIHNFDPVVSAAKSRSGEVNAFGYISRIIEWAGITRIKREEQQDYVKNKSVELYGITNDMLYNDGSFDSESVVDDFIARAYEYEEKHNLGSLAKADTTEAKPPAPARRGNSHDLADFLGNENDE